MISVRPKRNVIYMTKLVRIIILIPFLLIFSCNSELENKNIDLENKNNIKRVAHAGGSIEGDTYTNSHEALDYNIKRGFELFEIDFSWSKDQQLVCMHDWDRSFNRLFGFQIKQRPTLEAFKKLNQEISRYNICTLDSLKYLMEKNKHIKIITDIKEKNIRALRIIAEEIKDYDSRIIPQIYHPSEYKIVKKLGYKNIIWALYKFSGDNNRVLEQVDHLKLFAITMPPKRAKEKLGKKLKEKGIPTYVHTINSKKELKIYKENFGITEVYTDSLAPF
jgi:glycerophosphoryl diester phosphodiesterase